MTALLHLAAHLLALETLSRSVESRREIKLVGLERSAIAEAMRGPVPDLPAALFSTPERLFAWSCARVGRGSEYRARLALVTAPRLELPLDAWAELVRGTELELDLASGLRVRKGAGARLHRHAGHRVALARLLPHVEALSRGRPLPDTPAALRAVADWIERASGAEAAEDTDCEAA